jgi:hypothetical protein
MALSLAGTSGAADGIRDPCAEVRFALFTNDPSA